MSFFLRSSAWILKLTEYLVPQSSCNAAILNALLVKKIQMQKNYICFHYNNGKITKEGFFLTSPAQLFLVNSPMQKD